jgi:hypothetical protein
MPRRTRPVYPVLAFFFWLVLAVSACRGQGPTRAVGPNDDISIFTNAGANVSVTAELRRLFAYPVEVMGKEAAFFVEFAPFQDFRVHRHVKNQVLAVDLSGDDALARALPDMLAGIADEQLRARKPFLRLVRDYWAVGQTSLFAVAWSEEDLRRLLARADSTGLRREYEDAVVEGLTKTLYSMGEEEALARQTANHQGWTVRVLPNFFAAEDAQGHAVKFNAADPVRLILVSWWEGEIPLEAAAWEPLLADALWKYNDGDFVLAERSRVYAYPFQGEPALRWEGVWQNEKYVIGGPFRAFACHRDGKSFLLVGIVYAPGQDKVPALRQVEAMITTFRTVR